MVQAEPKIVDALLVQRARRGDLVAQASLYRRHRNSIYRLSYRLVGLNDADDLLQDSFEVAFTQLDRLREPSAFSVWLSAIAVRTAHKCLRGRAMLARLGLRPRTAVDVDLLASRAAPPDQAAEIRRICAMVERMPRKAQTALRLRRIEGFSLDEAAAKMDCSLATVKRRLDRVDQIMSQKLAEPSERDTSGSPAR